MRVTIAVVKVLSALLEEPDRFRYGLDLMTVTGLPSGTLYPLLRRMQDAGWVTAEWERLDPVAAARPARRYYRLTAEGIQQAQQALADLRATTTVHRPADAPRPRPAW
ncbi:PadR family transcriptional regulator [Phytohabitans houttuyneae]|uniref:Transcriptional regulator n=1 Tax=Phytohabitans houttuyneae TaxID=1076126 RepID=A0A6V8KK40_9ACTN|nr:PadR family transcriptional regulator [Phytohabitans houttuyneae]GFJ82117.1 transcriptional regulator [Phytohabitans houttuyneae]